MARLDPEPYPLPELKNVDFGAFEESEHYKAYKKLVEASEDLPDGKVVGALLRWQRGDGFAVYRVTKARPLTVQHVPYMDAWTVEDALIRGLNKNDVLAIVRRDKARRELFSQHFGTSRGI